jgi:hypothetical protein
VYVGGERVVEAGQHLRREAVARRFRATLTKLTRRSERVSRNG